MSISAREMSFHGVCASDSSAGYYAPYWSRYTHLVAFKVETLELRCDRKQADEWNVMGITLWLAGR